MITQIHPSVKILKAGQDLKLLIYAEYPVKLEIYGFLTDSFPTRCVLYPEDSPSMIHERIPVKVMADRDVFTSKGFLEIRVIDAAGDFCTLDVPVRA